MDIQTGGEPQMLDADLQAQIGVRGVLVCAASLRVACERADAVLT